MEFWTWMIVAVVVQLVVVFFGSFIARKLGILDDGRLNDKIRAISILPLLLVFLLFRPIVVSYFPDELFENQMLTPNSGVAESIETVNEHSRQIERLTREIKDLQKDAESTNEYYGFLSFFLLIVIGSYLLGILGDNKVDKDKVEKYPLGLNDDKEG